MSLKSLPLLIIITLNLLTACNGNNTAEKFFDPDAKLKEKNEKPIISPPINNTPTVKLPDNFPPEIPTYSQAKLVATEAGEKQGETQTFWTTTDNITLIFDYYQKKLTGWEIKNFDDKLSAKKGELSLEISLVTSTPETKFLLKYSPQTQQQTQEPPLEKPSETVTNTPEKLPVDNTANLTIIPDSLKQYISDVNKLGIIDNQDFNQPITRREFASLLFKINNLLYQDTPGKQVRLATESSPPVFTDIPKTAPDFSIIQGLAEAGIIPSKLSNDLTIVTFNPNNNLTREDLILWKIPLDSRLALPKASIEAIKDTWGFQDTEKINPKTLQALLVDFQNGEQSNVKRVFGFTTIFQPKKPVTRGEAAAALWYFGYQGDGKNVQSIQETNTTNTN
jgi:S-layer homology domain